MLDETPVQTASGTLVPVTFMTSTPINSTVNSVTLPIRAN